MLRFAITSARRPFTGILDRSSDSGRYSNVLKAVCEGIPAKFEQAGFGYNRIPQDYLRVRSFPDWHSDVLECAAIL